MISKKELKHKSSVFNKIYYLKSILLQALATAIIECRSLKISDENLVKTIESKMSDLIREKDKTLKVYACKVKTLNDKILVRTILDSKNFSEGFSLWIYESKMVGKSNDFSNIDLDLTNSFISNEIEKLNIQKKNIDAAIKNYDVYKKMEDDLKKMVAKYDKKSQPF